MQEGEVKSFDFSGSKAAEELILTLPGTIGIFNIGKIEFGESKDKKTPFMKLVFDAKMVREGDKMVPQKSSFNNSFYLTAGAMDRLQYVHKVLYGTEMTGVIDTATLTQKFLNKEIALKVTGQINTTNGKGYPDLGFAGFAKKPSEIDQLSFSKKEEALNAKVNEAIIHGGSDNADKEPQRGNMAPAPTTRGGGF
jgi:hypothetical protein